MRKVANTLWGIVLIILGIICTLNVFEITHINLFFDGWWTFLIIIPSFIEMIARKNKTWSIIWLIVGIILFLACRDILDFGMIMKLIFPVALILIGLNLIFKDKLDKRLSNKIKEMKNNNEDLEEYCATFGEARPSFKEKEFKGASLDAIFGSVELNLKNAIIKKDQIIKASAVFGGIDIIVPENINIKIKSTPIFGGVSKKVNLKYNEQLPTIYINAFCMFGGVSIK